MCIRCRFAVESHQDRLNRLDQAKAARRAASDRAARSSFNGNRTFPYPKIRDRYIPARPYRQNPNPAACTQKVISEMRKWGTRPR
jgi:hypothetical protein